MTITDQFWKEAINGWATLKEGQVLRWLIPFHQWPSIVKMATAEGDWIVQTPLQAYDPPTIYGIPVSVTDAPGMDVILVAEDA